MEAHAESHASTSRLLECSVVTPEMTILQTPATFVVLPLFDGEVGIAPGHTPLIGRLGYGEMRIEHAGKTERYYVDGGFVQVLNNNISVLTGQAIPSKDIDPAEAEENLLTARQRPAHSAEAIAIRERTEAQARAQVRVARRAHGMPMSSSH